MRMLHIMEYIAKDVDPLTNELLLQKIVTMT